MGRAQHARLDVMVLWCWFGSVVDWWGGVSVTYGGRK